MINCKSLVQISEMGEMLKWENLSKLLPRNLMIVLCWCGHFCVCLLCLLTFSRRFLDFFRRFYLNDFHNLWQRSMFHFIISPISSLYSIWKVETYYKFNSNSQSAKDKIFDSQSDHEHRECFPYNFIKLAHHKPSGVKFLRKLDQPNQADQTDYNNDIFHSLHPGMLIRFSHSQWSTFGWFPVKFLIGLDWCWYICVWCVGWDMIMIYIDGVCAVKDDIDG